jgi:superfamily II DNA or RNA helicase
MLELQTAFQSDSYKLRDYQEALLQKIFDSWARGNRRVLAQLPTGAGKTIVFSAIAREFLKQGLGVLVLAHREELILQAGEKLEALSGLPVGYIKAGMPVNADYDVQVASVQSLIRRKRFPESGLVIVDEAHHAVAKSYKDILDQYPQAYILGVTATPCRTDGQGFKWLFDDLITGPSPEWLISSGYLSPFRLYGASSLIDTKGVKKTAGDFNQGQLEDAAMKVVGDVVPAWRKHAEGKRTIVFAVGVDHSKAIASEFLKEGIPAEHLDGTTPNEERRAAIARFRSGETLVLSNCGLFTEGFDCPAVEAVQICRPTCSLILHLQMLGRALRPAEGKDFARIIDHTENWKNHGFPDEDRSWSLDPISLKMGRFVLQCPECEHCFKPLSHEQTKPFRHQLDNTGKLKPLYRSTCPNCLCEFEWEMGQGQPVGMRSIDKEAGEIQELVIQVNPEHTAIVDQILQIQQQTNRKPGWVYYRLLDHERIKEFGLGDWRYVAAKLGYKSGWAWHKWQEVQAS